MTAIKEFIYWLESVIKVEKIVVKNTKDDNTRDDAKLIIETLETAKSKFKEFAKENLKVFKGERNLKDCIKFEEEFVEDLKEVVK